MHTCSNLEMLVLQHARGALSQNQAVQVRAYLGQCQIPQHCQAKVFKIEPCLEDNFEPELLAREP